MMNSRVTRLTDLLNDATIYDLSVEFHPGMTRHLAHPPFMFSLLKRHADNADPSLTVSSCVFSVGGHTGTHLDARGHFARDFHVYGHDGDIRHHESAVTGLAIGGIETTPPIVRRGVLLDVAAFHGVAVLAGDHEIGAEDLARTAAAEGVDVRAGDVVLVRTGWMCHWEDQVAYESPAPGIDMSGADWFVGARCAFAGSDTSTFEKIDRTAKRVHGRMLADHGIQIMEMLNLEALGRSRHYEFVFVALPLRIRGGTGSPIRPIAIC